MRRNSLIVGHPSGAHQIVQIPAPAFDELGLETQDERALRGQLDVDAAHLAKDQPTQRWVGLVQPSQLVEIRRCDGRTQILLRERPSRRWLRRTPPRRGRTWPP